jgi:DNA polymerase-3 subunit beta
MKHHTPKIEVSAAELRRAVAFVASVAETRNTIPILGQIKVEVKTDQIELTATDLDIEASIKVPAEVSAPPLSFTVSPRLLSHIVRYAETVKLSRVDNKIVIEADDVVASFREIMPAVDFPLFRGSEDPPEGPVQAIAEAVLEKALRLAAVTISTEETRYYLNGVYLHHSDAAGGLRVVSTDGHRMTIYDARVPWGLTGVIAQTKTVALLRSALVRGGNREVSVAPYYTKSNDGHANLVALRFICDNWTIKAKLIDGTFPDYRRVMPQPSDKIAVVITDAALRRFPPTGERSRAVTINPDEGWMEQSAPDDISVRMPVQGRGARFGVDLRYLRDFARQSGTIRLEGAAPGDPFRVLTEDPDLLQIVMPMRV